jgi:class 3 adenylate cyclase/putative methionine-R-sulfoxide reductase with GAF domain
MARRSRAGSAKSRKPIAPKRASGTQPARPRKSSAVRQGSAVAQLARERDEALLREAANFEILRLISKSPGDVETVFRTILERATSICNAKFGVLDLYDGDALHSVAHFHTPTALIEALARRGPRPNPKTASGRVITSKQVVQIVDLAEDAAYLERDPVRVALVEVVGARTLLVVPMLKEDVLVGAIAIYRQEKQAFTDKQIAVVQNFAAQAVIAVENARLLGELRESLQQQTATADVLRVISSSPGELEPVFRGILENATRICQAQFGTLNLYNAGVFRTAALHNPPAQFAQRLGATIRPHPASGLARVERTKEIAHIDDIRKGQPYLDGDKAVVELADLADARTLVIVPMLNEENLVGAISIYRQEVRPFTQKQVELLQNFAAQAVIAIENARLLSELRKRTQELEARSQEIAKLNAQLEARVADQVGEIERMGRLRRFLPPQVADLIVASGSEKQLESHRREITALFCDLRGFTGFSESSDPEDVMALLAEYHAAIGTIINKYSGTLERYAGDGVMVIFNDPVPVENPALQAVLAALDMRTAIETLMEKWRLLGHDIGFSIGIAHGFATLGTIGFEGRRDYAAIGTVSNVASRLCDEAKPGQILISPRVLLAVDKVVKVDPVGEFALKGIRRPLQAYNVLASKPD